MNAAIQNELSLSLGRVCRSTKWYQAMDRLGQALGSAGQVRVEVVPPTEADGHRFVYVARFPMRDHLTAVYRVPVETADAMADRIMAALPSESGHQP